jgi:hypothetical protein
MDLAMGITTEGKMASGTMDETSQVHTEALVNRALAIGTGALDLLRRFGLEQMSAEELIEQLPALGAGAALAEYWPQLTGDRDLAAGLAVLQLVSTLETEARYQLLRYGPTSLHEDFRELSLAVKRINQRRETHDE